MVSHITGTHVAYAFICKRKLWLFAHGLHCEHESDAVRMGRHIHETTYERETKELDIDGVIVLDHLDAGRGIIHEVKKSDAMEEAHEWQLLYYLWYLKHKGVYREQRASGREQVSSIREQRASGREQETGGKEQREYFVGELNYPKLKKTKRVELTPEREQALERDVLPEIRRVLALAEPPPVVEWKVCKTCSYCELCHS